MKTMLMTTTLLLIFGCDVGKQTPSSSPPMTHAEQSQQQPLMSEWTQLEYIQHPCHGFCPVYSIVLQRDGHYVYIGERHTSQMGEFQSQLSAQRTQAVFWAYEQLHRLGLPEAIGRDNCALYATDHSVLEFKLKNQTHQWRFKHDLGCHDFSQRDSVLKLTQLIQASLPIREHVNPQEQ